MAERGKQADVDKVVSREGALRRIYEKVFKALSAIDRSKYKSEQLHQLDSALESPDAIAFDKAVAVLKAVMGSTSDDRMQLEAFSSAPAEGRNSVGELVGSELKQLGLSYGQLYTFVYERGWARGS